MSCSPAAAGDALGAPYEFGPARGPELEVAMVGGGIWEPGEWTDDTAMAIAIAEVAATGADLRDASAQDAIVARWHGWSRNAKDVGIQTGSVLRAAARDGQITAERARAESAKLHEHSGRTAGNGSLMRTAPVALAYLDDEDAMVAAARAISELTHYDPDAGDACVLWCCAIRHAVHTGQLDVRIGLRHIESDRRELWSQRLDEAESSRPADFAEQRLGGRGAAGRLVGDRHHPDPRRRPRPRACSAPIICGWLSTPPCGAATTPTPSRPSPGRCSAPPTALPRCRWGGARCCTAGPASPPTTWWHWPRPSSAKANPTGSTTATPAPPSTPSPTTPTTRGSCSAASASCASCPTSVDAVVSMCRLTDEDMRHDMPHTEVRLIDSPEPDENPHLDYVLLDTVRLVEQLRAEGRTVLVHCVAAYSRTPTVAALYGARLHNDQRRRGVATTSRPRCPVRTRIPRSGKRCGASRLSPRHRARRRHELVTTTDPLRPEGGHHDRPQRHTDRSTRSCGGGSSTPTPCATTSSRRATGSPTPPK